MGSSTGQRKQAKSISARALIGCILAGLVVTACNTTSTSQSPPPIPHKVTEQLCVTCHREGTNGAPKMNHSARGTCISCHAAS